MEFFSLLIAMLTTGTANLSVFLFLASVALLILGLSVKVRSSVLLMHLEHTPLNRIEFTHPNLPSARSVLTFVLCGGALLLAGFQTMRGVFPFDDPFQGLNLASLFLVVGAAGILADLKWKGAREYMSAVLVGTALSFLLLMMRPSEQPGLSVEHGLVLVLLLPSLFLLGSAFPRSRRLSGLLTTIFTFLFWVLAYLVR